MMSSRKRSTSSSRKYIDPLGGITSPTTTSPLHSPNPAAGPSRQPHVQLSPTRPHQHHQFQDPPEMGANRPIIRDGIQGGRGGDMDSEDEAFDPFAADPNLRLRTVTTAHSAISESIRVEALQEKRKRKRSRIFSGLKRMPTMGSSLRNKGSGRPTTAISEAGTIQTRDRSSTIGEASTWSMDQGRDGLLKDLTSSGRSRATSNAASTSTSRGTGTAASGVSESQQIGSDQQVEDKVSFPLSLFKTRKANKVVPRRSIHVNLPLPNFQVNQSTGDPIIRYVRNKVRTSKYTLITFLPKNLFEQFRRVANIYFLALVVLQLFAIFGAPNGQIGMLPLLAILGMTAIKDGIEDWRRSRLDDEVNNSATTKLEGWRNVNQPRDNRSFMERLFNTGPAPGRPSKGVKKLRQAEATAGKQIIMDRQKALEQMEQLTDDGSSLDNKPAYTMDNIPTLSVSSADDAPTPLRGYAPSTASIMSKRSIGVMDWRQPGPGNAQWQRTLWKKLEVGDMVLLSDNEQVPADIIVLSTSNADNLCFVETKNLDGETNLKVRKALKATSAISSEEDLEHAKFVIDSEAPHANLYNYNGVLKYTPANDKAEMKQEAVTINELLLRGCSLRNTKWVIGLVVFTGEDTKIMLNGGDTPSKRSKIEKETNFNVIMNFVVLMVLCALTAILHGYYRSLSGTSREYYEPDSNAAENIVLDSVIIFFSCLIVFQNIVPISLYITIEIVKTIQAFFIFQDIEMYYDVYDTPCVPKTWNISDDLGQIEYVFSDKTGTLTQNIMEFKKCTIKGITFGEGMTEAMMGAAKRDGKETGPAMEDQQEELEVSKEQMLKTMKQTINNRYLRDDKLTLISPDMANRLANPSDPIRPHIIDFFRALAICHSVLSDAPEPTQPFILDYKAESPDEAALVAAARDVGFPFVTRTTNRIDVEVLGKVEHWTPLRVLEFNSSRKRMSVIARDPDGRIVLFCKGADSVIYERLAKDHDRQLKESTLKDLETFANGGLRTLCISYRYLSEQEFADWSKDYDAACAAVHDRDAEIDKSCEIIEHSLLILGATALEDKLQEGVPDAIATLHRAGIKLWILTGDKLQTAIEIGYSCNLLTNDMEVMIISTDSEEGARAQIEAGLNKIASVLGPPPVGTKKGKVQPIVERPAATFAVVIDGESLRYALQPNLKPLFLQLGTQCSAVICCRVSPSQKALTVRLVKEGCNAMTLAIGDGANDVAMIQEANVGVGLYGLEGSQAAMSADYAFGQFRFLTRLLLVHGKWSYVRIADMHANFFYKNVIWTLSMFWFFIYNSFDATYLFDYTLLLFYNLFFTSLPVGIMGAFDQDTNARASLAFPQLYKRGVQGLDYTRKRFWLYMLDGLYQSLVLFFVPFAAYGAAESWSNTGRDTDALTDLGTTAACAGVLAANLYVGINTRYWTIVTAAITIISTLLIFIWIPIYSALSVLPFSGEVGVVFPTFPFWATIVMTTFIAVGPRWLVRAFKQSYMPMDKDIIREAWITGDLKNQLGIARRHRKKKQRQLSNSSRREENVLEETTLEDDKGLYYHPAAIASPQRDYSRSPFEAGGIRAGHTYPPESPLIPGLSPPNSLRGSVPPPLVRSGSSQGGSSKGNSSGYTSPKAREAYNMTSMEIDRLARESIHMKRASLSAEESLTSPEGSGKRKSMSLPNHSAQGSPVRTDFGPDRNQDGDDVFHSATSHTTHHQRKSMDSPDRRTSGTG